MYQKNRFRKTTTNENSKQRQQQKLLNNNQVSSTPIQISQSNNERRAKLHNINAHTSQKQKQYEEYYQISQGNPNGIIWTSTLFPHSAEMSSKFNLPTGLIISPMIALDNQGTQVIEKRADQIPRCANCKAYMNCYNTIQKKRFTCFICNRETILDKSYHKNQAIHYQMSSTIYQVIGSPNFFQKQPTQQTFIFFVDVSSESYNSKMLYFMVLALKQVLERPQLDDLCIQFFTYDELVHQYDFSGEQIRCNIIDPSILTQQNSFKNQPVYLKDIRIKLFSLLGSLEKISQQNYRKGYNFSKCFKEVFNKMKTKSGKFFVFQTNEALSIQKMFTESSSNAKDIQLCINSTKTQSFYETKNREFFETYTQQMLKNYCSISFFCFSRTYKSLRVLSDALKLTNSQIKLYQKDSPTELYKFYYDLSYLVGATYFKSVVTQFIISSGWNFTGIYGNAYRIKQTISFQMNWLEPSRKLFIMVTPTSSNSVSPFCGIQMITNYCYKRQNFVSIATIVQPITGFTDRLYASIDVQTTICGLAKKFLSALRMQPIKSARQKLIETVAKIYKTSFQVYKKHQNIPDTIVTIILSTLAMLKSVHSQPQMILNTNTLDRVISQRNILQFSSIDLSTYFNPYLFDLSALETRHCQYGSEFQYPPTVQLRFHNIRQGIFLLDSGLYLYLFVAKQFNPDLLKEIFGKSKLTKHDNLNQQLLMQQTSQKAIQVQNLIKFLRQQKIYGWAPLYIICCGENTIYQKNFYLNFYNEKYEEYKIYKLNLEQYLAIISKSKAY